MTLTDRVKMFREESDDLQEMNQAVVLLMNIKNDAMTTFILHTPIL